MGKGSWFKKTDSYLHKHILRFFKYIVLRNLKYGRYDIGDHIQVSTMILGGFYVLRPVIEAIDGAENVFSDQTLIDFFSVWS